MTSTPNIRRKRGSMSAEEILKAAYEIVSKDGVTGLSMPLLAKRLKCGVASIYWYFPSKDALLVALTESVAREVYRSLPPIVDGPWDQQMIDYFSAFRKFIESEPVYREMFAYRGEVLMAQSAIAPSMQRRLNAGLEILIRAGFSAEQGSEVLGVCASYTRGFVALREAAKRSDEQQPFGRWQGLGTKQFEFGLRLLLVGLGDKYQISNSVAVS